MKKLLFVLPDLEYNGAARQMLYLAMGLPRDRFNIRVCVLQTAGQWRKELPGIPIDVLDWRRTLDIRPILGLRRIIRSFKPDLIHAWRTSALGAVLVAKAGTACRVVVSFAAPRKVPGIAKRALNRWLLGRADKVLAGGAYEARVLETLGVDSGRIMQVPPAVGAVSSSETVSLRGILGLAPDRRLIACIGPLESHKGFRDAIWALDILRFLFDNIDLVILGIGPAEDDLRHFAHVLQVEDFVHFLGPQENVLALLPQVDMVWVPSHRNTGVNAVLEAMAAGRPLIATHMPALVELVPPEGRGTLVAPHNQGSLARQARLALDDPGRQTYLGELGRKRVAERHSVTAMVEQCVLLYEGH